MARCVHSLLLSLIVLWLRSVASQDLCATYVEQNRLTLTSAVLRQLEASGTALNDVVGCLTDDGSLEFDVRRLRIDETLVIDRPLNITSLHDPPTVLICDGLPIFDLRANVEISRFRIRDCELESNEAPVVIRSEAEVSITASDFVGNRNSDGSATIYVEANSNLTLLETTFRRNNGSVAAAVRAEEDCRISVSSCEFVENRGIGSVLSLKDAQRLDIEATVFRNNLVESTERGGVIRIRSDRRTRVNIGNESVFQQNQALGSDGGALYIQGAINLRIDGETRFTGNSAAGRGGAVYVSAGGKISIRDAFFTDNASNFTGGGAMFAIASKDAALEIVLSRSVFSRNAAQNYLGSGGALRFQGGGVTIQMADSVTFVLNTAELNGGAMYISNGAQGRISDASFVGNEALSGGAGAFYMVSLQKRRSTTMAVEIERSSFIFNRALYTERGGGTIGVSGYGAELTIAECEFSDNDGGLGSGGALYLYSGPVANVVNSTFKRNKATWGAALYAENDAQYVIGGSRFENNTAGEGGALNVRGDVDVTIEKSVFSRNSATAEGGAIKVRNFKSGGDELAKVIIRDSNFTDNVAGANLFEDALYGTVTRGGVLIAVGNGVDLDVFESVFRSNHASEGGALHINAVADCNTNGNRFFDNRANFGGAIYIVVDEQVRPTRFDQYLVFFSVIRRNSAENSGGAVFISSSNAVSDDNTLNARVHLVKFASSSFTHNRATRNGGAFAMTGAGGLIEFCQFKSNMAGDNTPMGETAKGGALMIQNGAALRCTDSSFQSNRAGLAGAVAVVDASVQCGRVDFISNSVADDGVGGAVGIELSAFKDIPVLNSGNRLRNIIFECDVCMFEQNNGSQSGGALYFHDQSTPDSVPFESDCSEANQFEELTADDELTCPTYFRYLTRLDNRVVRFSNTAFKENSARAGGAIFTDNSAAIIVTPDVVGDDGIRMDRVFLRYRANFTDAQIVFDGNHNFENGYGPDYATAPVRAMLSSLDYNEFQSGQQLEFNVTFEDRLKQKITVDSGVAADLSFNQANSEEDLEVSGQLTADMGSDGYIRFNGTGLKGASNVTYNLTLQYRSTSDRQTLSLKDSRITVTMRFCKIGEFTDPDDRGRIECRSCPSGTFTSDPLQQNCTSCSDIEHGSCFGDTIVPDERYWHPSSFSTKMYLCVGHEACKFSGRTKTIQDSAEEEHQKNGRAMLYTEGSAVLCRPGYEGPLCGTCAQGYGRSTYVCQKCASAAARSLLLLFLIIWSFGFLTYFIRSVLQLASRIDFNKRFNQEPTELQRRFMESIPENRPPEETYIPEELSFRTLATGTEILPSSSQVSPSSSMAVRISTASSRTGNGLRRPDAPSRADRARLAANQIHMSRLKSLRPTGMQQIDAASVASDSPSYEKKSLRLRGRLVGKLQIMVNSKTPETIEPLTLANPVSEILKILVNFLQVTSVAVSINVDWTQPLRRTLSIMGSLGSVSSSSEYMSLDCFMSDSDEWRSLRRMAISILFPLLVFMIYVVLWSIYAFVKKAFKNYLTQRVWLTYLAINYFIYIGLTRNLLRFLACVRIEAEEGDPAVKEELVWEEDTSIQCFSRRHAVLVGVLVLPLLIVVTLGFPIGTFIILRRNKDNLEDQNFVATYGFLYRAYDRYYWEVIVLLRKGLVATAAVFSYILGENLQGLLCILVIVIALSLHLTFQPFTQEIPQLNYLETFSLSATVVVFVAGLMMNDPKTSFAGRVLLSIIAIVFVCSAVVTMLFELMVASQEVVDMKLIELELMEIAEVIEARLSRKLEVLLFHYWRLVQNGILVIVKHLKRSTFPSKKGPPPPPVPGSLQMTGTV